MATPNMGLQLPAVGVTVGPAWASVLNTALEVVDAHDHTPGNGLAITPEALDIDSDVDFQGNAATLLSRVELVSQAATTVLPGAVYVVGGDLWFTNAAGTPIQLTIGSTPAAGGGSISGMTGTTASASYDSGTKFFIWNQSPTLRAGLDAGNVTLRQGSVGTAAYVALAAPTSGVTSYTLRLPGALPVTSTGYFSVDTSGNGTWAYLDAVTLERSGTTLRIKDSGVTTAKIAVGNVTGGVTAGAATGSIAYRTVVTENLAELAVTTAKLADAPNGVTTGKINDAQVTTAKLANAPNGVTTAKINDQQVTTAKIADAPNGVTTGKITDGAVTTAKLADAPNGITTAKINDGQVTTAKIATGNVTGTFTGATPTGSVGYRALQTESLAELAVTTAKLADAPNGVTTGKISDGAVTTAKLANAPNGVTTGKINDGQVTTAKIADAPNGVTTGKITDGAVTTAKLANGAVTPYRREQFVGGSTSSLSGVRNFPDSENFYTIAAQTWTVTTEDLGAWFFFISPRANNSDVYLTGIPNLQPGNVANSCTMTMRLQITGPAVNDYYNRSVDCYVSYGTNFSGGPIIAISPASMPTFAVPYRMTITGSYTIELQIRIVQSASGTNVGGSLFWNQMRINWYR